MQSGPVAGAQSAFAMVEAKGFCILYKLLNADGHGPCYFEYNEG